MKSEIQHPSAFLETDVVNRLRDYALGAEGLKKLHEKQLAIVYQYGWFKMFVPKLYGGLELSLTQVLQTEEALSWVDGSTAWVVTLCSGAGWFVGFIEESLHRDLFMDDKMCFAGSGAVTGTAEVMESGYTINGRWQYASGAEHASVFTANCYLTQNGKSLLTADGTPRIASFILRREEVTLHRTWKAMGMMATGSHSFEVIQLNVPSDRCFYIDAQHTVLPHAVYKYPFLHLAETTLAVNLSGMALRFMELSEIIFKVKEGGRSANQSNTPKVIKDKSDTLNEARSDFYAAVRASWESLADHKQIPESILHQVSEASHRMVAEARQSVNALYPLCGLRAANTESEINRVWRNFHTASQHALFNR